MADKLDLLEPKERKIFFSKQVYQDSIEKVTKEIIDINDSDKFLKKQYKLYGFKYKPKQIKIYIDSYGGIAYQIMGLIGVMEKSKTPIHTICTGAAMSCGFLMLINGHKRFTYKHSTILYHQVANYTGGKVQDIKEDLMETERLQSMLEEMTIRLTKISKSKIDKIRKQKIDWFMTAEEALKLKVVDKIV